VEHVERIEKLGNAYKILVEKPEWMILFGSLRRGCEYNNKIYLK